MLRFLLLLALVPVAANSISGEEIAIVTCDVLPVVEVQVSGLRFHFLVDTAATSMLNVNSFAVGKARNIAATSWSGTAETKAKQVTINDLSVGDHHFYKLVLPSVDLSAIARACGRQIDGVLGIDLLRKVGAVLHLRDRTPRLRIDAGTPQSLLKKLDERIASCKEAFNRRDDAAISDCLDPEVVVFRDAVEFRGRQDLMKVFQERYSSSHTQLSVKPCSYQVFGEAVWMECEFQTNVGKAAVVSRGSAFWSNEDGKWRIVHLDLGTRFDNDFARWNQ